MMVKMQAIFFSNYLLIENFLDDCTSDVNKFTCGRIQTEDEEEVWIIHTTYMYLGFHPRFKSQDHAEQENIHNYTNRFN